MFMNHGLPKISMFRSCGRLQAHKHPHTTATSTYAPSTVQVLKTYNTVIPHIDYWPVGRVVTCLRNASSSFSYLRSRQCNGRCGTSSLLEVVTAGGCDCNPLTNCQYDETKFHIESKPSIFPRGQYSLSIFHVHAFVMNTTAICHVYRYDTGIRNSKFEPNFPVSHADVLKHYGMLYYKESYPATHYTHFKSQTSFVCTANR